MKPHMHFKYLATSSALALLAGMFSPWASSSDTQILRIKGSSDESGDVIQLPGSASIQVTTTSEGVTLTLPGLDVRLRCLGQATGSGYCYIAAGAGGSGEDSDGDGVPDEWENSACTNTPANALTNDEGCADVDGDGYFTDQDDCPTQGGTVGADGCPADNVVNYTITASAGTGGSITPSGSVSVASGSTRSFTVAADNGYSVQGVSGSCGGNLAGNVYTTESITGDCTVTATFATQATGAGYCQGAPAGYADKLSCSSSLSLDPFAAKTTNYPGLGIPSGKVLSLPFTTGSNASVTGIVKLNSLQFVPSGYEYRAWFSTLPAGEVYENRSVCQYFGTRAFKSMKWNQGEGSGCDLAVDTVFHFNMEVFCTGDLASCTQGSLWSGEYFLELTNQDF